MVTWQWVKEPLKRFSQFPDHHKLYLLPFTPKNRALCPLLLTSCRQHTSILLFLSSPHTSVPLPLILSIFQVPTLTPNHSSGFPSFCQQCLYARPWVRGCTFLFVVGNYGSPQPLGWLVPLFCSCHHEDFIGAHSFTGSMPLLTPNLSFRIWVVPGLKPLPRFLRNVVEN